MSSQPENRWRLVLRVALVGIVAVLLQDALISQISIFGVSADITVLAVMSIGMLCGSLEGAVAGFAIGLLVDFAGVQTLGVTSLLYIPIGYWCGRLAELSDTSTHGLIPLGTGAAATLLAELGMTVIQFILGADSAVSGLLFQQIFMTVLINTLIALPVYHAVRRLLRRALPRDPRRRSRGYTAGALSPLSAPRERPRAAERLRGGGRGAGIRGGALR